MFTRKRKKWPKWIPGTPHQCPDADSNGAIITFINHASFLIQIGDLKIITDPVFSNRIGPKGIGPKRRRATGIKKEDLPNIDIIVISHNHYDHMDVESLRYIIKKSDPAPIILAPLGDARYLNKKGIKNVIELDWWEHLSVNDDLKIHFVPSLHFSGRRLFDRNKSL